MLGLIILFIVFASMKSKNLDYLVISPIIGLSVGSIVWAYLLRFSDDFFTLNFYFFVVILFSIIASSIFWIINRKD